MTLKRIATDPDTDAIVIDADDDFGGDTKAHYLPIEPRTPASDLRIGGDPRIGDSRPVTKSAGIPASIAEMFQDMLWRAYLAGAASSGHPVRGAFEDWYQREVVGA